MTNVSYEIGHALHALDQNQFMRQFRGYSNVSGGPVQVSNNSDILAPTPWEVLVNGSTVSVDGNNNEKTPPSADPDNPKWILCYIDTAGELQFVEGNAKELVGTAGRETRNPAPPSANGLSGTVIAAIYRKAGETSLDSNFVFDRRMSGQYVVDSMTAKSFDTEKIGSNYHYAEAYDGGDADARLDNAISAAVNGDMIHLEAVDYTTDRTISKNLSFAGSGGRHDYNMSRINATWTVSARCVFDNIAIGSAGTVVFNATICRFSNGRGPGSITVKDGFAMIIGCANIDVTFESGTSSGIVDSGTNQSVTDNGGNTVGDIA